eukprot:CAMPEP_0114413646 /NCGR_PEP_ID=MMETSP0103-20121206/965_1 /TAXON_ID=37642 ORGANISM="Paraphysomonas imperforata, Strain PA2" /NCGR_SAMPLE_ID=MMETSP0103 /ASSEMBLY_ACC=CAM_ASM_000201 /LENGTH=48 /DNA_ID= /DNA_START= /DNA_END= /DNA_ORIENTATION=
MQLAVPEVSSFLDVKAMKGRVAAIQLHSVNIITIMTEALMGCDAESKL